MFIIIHCLACNNPGTDIMNIGFIEDFVYVEWVGYLALEWIDLTLKI